MFPSHVVNAGLSIDPNSTGLPGIPAAKTVVGALITYGLIACVVGIVVGASLWGWGSHAANPHHAEKGRVGVVVSAAAATVIGSAVGLVNFFGAIHIA